MTTTAEQGFAQVHHNYEGLVKFHIRSRCRPEERQDMEQVVWAKVWQLLLEDPSRNVYPGFIEKLVNYQINNHNVVARVRRRDVISLDQPDESGNPVRPATEVGIDDHAFVREAVNELPAEYRGIVKAHFYDGKTTAEIAKAAGVTADIVLDRLHEGVELLKSQLNLEREVVSRYNTG